MSERERKMLVMIVAIVVVFGHVLGSQKLVEAFNKKKADLQALERQAQMVIGGNAAAEAIEQEKQWLDKYEPQPETYGDVQTELQNFLVTAGQQVGLEPFSQELIPNLDLAEGQSQYYDRVRIQISAQGEQDKIIQWLVNIHQPEQFRAITYLKLEANEKAEGEVICHIIAEQWLVPKI